MSLTVTEAHALLSCQSFFKGLNSLLYKQGQKGSNHESSIILHLLIVTPYALGIKYIKLVYLSAISYLLSF
jgi:hypothetical protein